MFFPIRFKTTVQLSPEELSDELDTTIREKLTKTLEGVCSRFGYIKPGSLDIVRRSAGVFTKQHFNGHIKFEVCCRGEVCNPPQGIIVDATVKNKNALGLLATSSIMINTTNLQVLDIIVPRKSNGITSEVNLDDINIGDDILVMVMGKRYQLNDTSISIIGCVVKQRDKNNTNVGVSVEGADDTSVQDASGTATLASIPVDVDVEDAEAEAEADGIDYEDVDEDVESETPAKDDEEEEEEELELDEFDEDFDEEGDDEDFDDAGDD